MRPDTPPSSPIKNDDQEEEDEEEVVNKPKTKKETAKKTLNGKATNESLPPKKRFKQSLNNQEIAQK